MDPKFFWSDRYDPYNVVSTAHGPHILASSQHLWLHGYPGEHGYPVSQRQRQMARRQRPQGTPFAKRTYGQTFGYSAGYKRARSAPMAAAFRGRRSGYARTGGYYGRFAPVVTGSPELKFHDIDIDDAAIATNGTIAEDSCNGIAQGVTESQRVGRKCVIRSINWRWTIRKPSITSVGFGSDCVRVILYLDKQCNGATASVTDILESDDYQSFNNLANKGRFKILMDRSYNVNSPGAAGDGVANDLVSVEMNDSFYKKCNIPLEFDSTTGAITEVRSNNLGVLLLSRDGTNTTVSFASKMRLRFSDI